MITMADIAKAAGVSQTLVSFVLNNNEKELKRITSETCERVRETARQLGYRRNTLATAMVTGRTNNIALVVLAPETEFYGRILASVMTYAQQRDHTVSMHELKDEADAEKISDAVIGGRCAGLILMGLSEKDAAFFVDDMKENSIPSVLIESEELTGTNFTRIRPDDAQGVELILEHLRSLGHERIGYVRPPEMRSAGIRRRQLFLDACEKHAIATSEEMEFDFIKLERDDAETVERAFNSSARPTAFVCYNDLVAMWVLQAAYRHNIRVPDDLSVTGYDGISYSELSSPPLTTIRQPLVEIGAKACEAVISLSQGKIKPGGTTIMPVELIVRDSTGPAPDRN